MIYDPYERLEHIYPNWKKLFPYSFTMSALTGLNVNQVKEFLHESSFSEKWMYHPDMVW